MIVASKWSQSLKNLMITGKSQFIFKLLSLARGDFKLIPFKITALTGLHEMESFHLMYWLVENMDETSGDVVAKAKNFEGASSQSNIYVLVHFEDNCGELS